MRGCEFTCTHAIPYKIRGKWKKLGTAAATRACMRVRAHAHARYIYSYIYILISYRGFRKALCDAASRRRMRLS